MTWQKDIDELKHRRELARQMGGAEGIARQRAKGRLTARERVDLLLDQDSFQEIATLAGRGTYDDRGELQSFTPANVVVGCGQINGRTVCVTSDDFTIRGGSEQAAGMIKMYLTEKIAREWRVPLVCLRDSAGGTGLPQLDKAESRVGDSWSRHWVTLIQLLPFIPVASAVLGSSGGGSAVEAVMSHFSIMTRHASELFVGGPPIIKPALNIDITKEELGNYKVHACQSGVIDNVAEDEEDAFRQIRLFLSYLPQNVWHQPSRVDMGDDPNRREEEILSIIPKNSMKTYNIRQLIKHIVDKDSLFEISPFYGRSFITMLARMDGYPVALMSNDCTWFGGAQDTPGTEKMTRFVDLADTFHLPLIYLVDVPGYMIGPDAEKTGTLRKAARANFAIQQASVPWATVFLRRSFGVAGSAAHGGHNQLTVHYAWPSVQRGAIPIRGGATAAYRRQIEAAPDPEAKRIEIEGLLRQMSSPFRLAESGGGGDIIDPRDTRPLLCQFVRMAQEITATQLGPKFPGMRP